LRLQKYKKKITFANTPCWILSVDKLFLLL